MGFDFVPHLDHPRHLKSEVQFGDEYQIYTGDKYTNAWSLGTLKPSFFYFLFNDLLQHRKINILLKQEKNTKTQICIITHTKTDKTESYMN